MIQILLQKRLVDFISLDYKAPETKFTTVTHHKEFELFNKSLKLLINSDISFEVRTTVHTNILDENDVNHIIEDLHVKGYKGNYYIQNFLYDDNTIKFEKFERTPFSEKFIISENKERGKIRIGMFTVSPVNKNGNLLNLIFSRKKTNNNKVILNLNKFQLNDDVIMYAKRDVIFEENQAAFKKYILEQNYPNPFNSSTMINYFVGESAFGFLKIFNMFGQEVKTLVEGRISKGIHRVIWDGKNSNACKVSNGVYVYQLCIDGNKINKKLIIME